MITIHTSTLSPELCRQLSRIDKDVSLPLSPHRFLLPVQKGHRVTKNLISRVFPQSGGTKVGMSNTSAAAFRRGHCILSQEIAMPTFDESDLSHLLTLQEAARRLTVSKRTLERLIASGQFPHPVKINRSSRVLKSDLDGYLQKIESLRRR